LVLFRDSLELAHEVGELAEVPELRFITAAAPV